MPPKCPRHCFEDTKETPGYLMYTFLPQKHIIDLEFRPSLLLRTKEYRCVPPGWRGGSWVGEGGGGEGMRRKESWPSRVVYNRLFRELARLPSAGRRYIRLCCLRVCKTLLENYIYIFSLVSLFVFLSYVIVLCDITSSYVKYTKPLKVF